jgi:hypothetical protein
MSSEPAEVEKVEVPAVPIEVEEIVVPDIEPKDVIASKEDVDKLTEAIQELTKIVGELHAENVKWFRAGKMGG